MLVAQYLPSALSKVATRSLLCFERYLLESRTLPVSLSLERAPVGGRRFRPSVAVVSGCRFRPNFGRMEFGNFCFRSFCFMRLSSGFAFGDICTSSGTSCPVPLWVSLTVALSVSRMRGKRDTAFSVVACCTLWRTFSFLSHPSLCMARAGNLFTCAH